MSNGQEKKRTSIRVSTDTLDDLESYRTENELDNRSEAFEHMVAHHNEVKESLRWETVAQQALYAVTFSLLVAAISLVAFIVALVQAGYPSPWTIVSFGFLFGGIIAGLGGGIATGYSRSKIQTTMSDTDGVKA